MKARFILFLLSIFGVVAFVASLSAQEKNNPINSSPDNFSREFGTEITVTWNGPRKLGMSPPDVIVEVKTLIPTNLNCFKPPCGLPGIMILKNEAGQMILAKNSATGNFDMFPAFIPLSSLPRNKIQQTIEGSMAFRPNAPVVVLGIFNLRQEFAITNDGTYTLTLWPKMYRVSPDTESVVRIDLPPKKVEVHLPQ